MILLIGLPKSGTSSFHKLFSDLGYKSYHWKKDEKHIGSMMKNNKINNKPLLCDFLDTDVVMVMNICFDKDEAYWPQVTDYERLYNENPNSIFILNKRDPEKVLSSFKRWYRLYENLLKNSPELLPDSSNESFIDFVNKHYTNIETFFSQKPNAKFVTFDIENDNLEKLEKYIDLKNIKHFPHENKNPIV